MVSINSACQSQLECGMNAICNDQKVCTCTLGLSTLNGIDCCNLTVQKRMSPKDRFKDNFFCLKDGESLTTTRINVQFVYQDVLKPPDEYDQIMFIVKNTYDQFLFNYSLNSEDVDSYRLVETEAYQYSLEKTQWYIHTTISFSGPIKLTQDLFSTLIETLNRQKQFQVLTALDSPG
jgi:hypothetical protein